MGIAAYKKKVFVSSVAPVAGSRANWEEIPEMSSSLDLAGDVLDDTTTKVSGSGGFRSRTLGLRDWSVNFEGLIEEGTPTGALDAIRSAWMNRTRLWVQYLPNATDSTNPTLDGGYQGEVKVETFSQNGDQGGLEQVSGTLQADGAIAVAT